MFINRSTVSSENFEKLFSTKVIEATYGKHGTKSSKWVGKG